MTKWESTALRGHAFHWNQNLLQIQTEGSSILGNTNSQGAHRILSYLCYFPVFTYFPVNHSL